eukprot:5415705-Prorocentrum_lima.AAC.1
MSFASSWVISSNTSISSNDFNSALMASIQFSFSSSFMLTKFAGLIASMLLSSIISFGNSPEPGGIPQ